MNSIIGFSLFTGVGQLQQEKIQADQQKVVKNFPDLHIKSVQIAGSRLDFWGRGELGERVHSQPDGGVVVLVGSPQGAGRWKEELNGLTGAGYRLPWDGRVVLLKVSGDGKRWELWNDWVGSIPVFWGEVGGGRVASTLEPVVVQALGVTAEDIYLPALASLMINGHYLSDWSLYRQMKVMRPDSYVQWDAGGYDSVRLWTVKPSQDRWEAGWDDLVEEMYELSKAAIVSALKEHPVWILPLSSGLDSRLIAGVGAEAGVEMHAYSWGAKNATDVVYGREIARTLGIPWKRVDIGTDYLVKYTRRWAEMFGTSMHFHGMYQMAFLDAIKDEIAGPVINGLIGDILAGDDVKKLTMLHSKPSAGVYGYHYKHWVEDELIVLMRLMQDEIETLKSEILIEIDTIPGANHQKLMYLELFSRSRYFTNFSPTLLDYWRGVQTPFMNRAYAQFCLSLPRAVLDDRRLLGDVYRYHFGKLAVIPGTYANVPLITTGRYHLNRRLARLLPAWLHFGEIKVFSHVPLHMDAECVMVHGWESLWPIPEAWDKLGGWIDTEKLTIAYNAASASNRDIKPVRKLQSVQALAYALKIPIIEKVS